MPDSAPVTRTKASMKTIDKAFVLLDFFTVDTPEWRLSDLARAAGFDKVTTMRVINSLCAGGFAEQNPETKTYRLGPAVLRLARVREATFPFSEIVQPILDRLAAGIGETAHACIFNGEAMISVAIAEPERSARVFVDRSQPLPVYATASGLAYLAFLGRERARDLLERVALRAYASGTPRDLGDVQVRLEQAAGQGFALSAQTFEDDTTGIAAPVFDWQGKVQATIAAACVDSRLNDTTTQRIIAAVCLAAREASDALGGLPPAARSAPEETA